MKPSDRPGVLLEGASAVLEIPHLASDQITGQVVAGASYKW